MNEFKTNGLGDYVISSDVTVEDKTFPSGTSYKQVTFSVASNNQGGYKGKDGNYVKKNALFYNVKSTYPNFINAIVNANVKKGDYVSFTATPDPGSYKTKEGKFANYPTLVIDASNCNDFQTYENPKHIMRYAKTKDTSHSANNVDSTTDDFNIGDVADIDIDPSQLPFI